MANIELGDIVRVTVRGFMQGQPVFNIFYFTPLEDYSGTYTPEDVAIIINTRWIDSMLPVQNIGYVLSSVLGQISFKSAGPSTDTYNAVEGLIYYSNAQANGNLENDGLPSNVCAIYTQWAEWSPGAGDLMSSRSAHRIGGLDESQQDNGTLENTAAVDIEDALGFVLDTIELGTGANLHQVIPTVQGLSTPTINRKFHLVLTSSLRGNLRTLRRRGKGTSTGGYSS